nr:C-type lectin-like protein [Oriental turtle dovepox virus]
MNRQSSKRLKKTCAWFIHLIASMCGTGLLGLFVTNVTLYRQIKICGNRDGMSGWVQINNNCYTMVENITFNELIGHCAKHDSIIPNALDQSEVLIVSSVLGVKDHWMPFTKKSRNWFHGRMPVNVKGDGNKRMELGKPLKPDESEKCTIYYDNGIIEENCEKKHKGICFSPFF